VDTENYTLEYLFQHMPGSLPAQSQQMYSSQANAFPSQPELNNWTKVSYKHTIESKNWLNQTSTSNGAVENHS
jgi:hypothetical protein